MKMLVVGDCTPLHRYELVDATAATEAHFESDVARALSCYRVGHRCIPFKGSFVHEGRAFHPDLALIAPDFSHWFVIEVELVSHSLKGHVLPQVRGFRYGEWQRDCITSLSLGLEIERGAAETLLELVQPSIVVVADQRIPEWEIALQALDVELLVVSGFRSPDGNRAFSIDGELACGVTNLGLGTYSATDRAIRMAPTLLLPDGLIQIHEPEGGIPDWTVKRDGPTLWIRRISGQPNLLTGEIVQLRRDVEGRVLLRRILSRSSSSSR